MFSDSTIRVLTIDDNPSIHVDYRKVLTGFDCSSGKDKQSEARKDLQDAESILFGTKPVSPEPLAGNHLRNFEIDSAESGQAGWELVKQSVAAENPYSVAFVDMRMPNGWNGVDTTKRIWELDPDLPIVFCTAYTDYSWEEMVNELDRPDQFLVLKKPFDNVELRQLAHCQSEKRRLSNLANLKQEQLEKMVEQRTREIKSTRDVVFFSLARIAESRDNSTGRHLERIGEYTLALGEWMTNNGPYQDQFDSSLAKHISDSSVLHDIGKIGIPDSILQKPGRLTPDEFEVMKTHVQIGADALDEAIGLSECCEFLSLAAEIARFHHERFDGTGYPRGIQGTDIPLSARIVALADVFDALTSKRVYKDAMEPLQARELINIESGKHFDPAVVSAFNACWDQFLANALENQKEEQASNTACPESHVRQAIAPQR